MSNFLPKVQNTYFQEKDGVYKVASIINNLGLIFRETTNADVGIDGHIEYVTDDYNASGQIIAVQIKSGTSFFKNETNTSFKYYPEKKHKLYWEKYPLPVILLLHNPENDLIYFTDARFYLKNPDNFNKSYIEIDKINILKDKKDLFYTLGMNSDINYSEGFDYISKLKEKRTYIFPDEIDDINYLMNNIDLLSFLINKKSIELQFSFFELFLGGLTNIGTQLFFNIELIHNLNSIYNTEDIMFLGEEEFYFLHQYVKFLINQNLVNIDYDSYLLDIDKRKILPQFLATLTSRGISLNNFILSQSNRILRRDTYIVSESFININLSENYAKIKDMKEFRKKYELISNKSLDDE